MLDPDRIAFLQTESGAALLAEAAAAPGDLLARLTALRRLHAPDAAAAAVELLDLRRRAAARFSRADTMYLTAAGLEQATSEAVAYWRASRYPSGAVVADLCCGIGSDALALGARGPVLAIDRDLAACRCVAANARVYRVADQVSIACADVTRLRLRADAAFLDPSRRPDGRRTVQPESYAPPLDFAREVRAAIPDLCVKVSPGLSDDVFESLGARVEFVSERGECKEAALWFGELGPTAARSASVLPAGVSLCVENAPAPPVHEPLAWLYEPDPAVIRAHLIAEIAQRLGAALLDPRIAYLTADRRSETPFATAYGVIEWMPFNLRRLRERMRALGLRASVVKKRGVPFEPEQMRRRLPLEGDRDAVVVFARLRGDLIAVLCEQPARAADTVEASGKPFRAAG
jgi:hypothetical protein